jgi:hypothetical protein
LPLQYAKISTGTKHFQSDFLGRNPDQVFMEQLCERIQGDQEAFQIAEVISEHMIGTRVGI